MVLDCHSGERRVVDSRLKYNGFNLMLRSAIARLEACWIFSSFETLALLVPQDEVELRLRLPAAVLACFGAADNHVVNFVGPIGKAQMALVRIHLGQR